MYVSAVGEEELLAIAFNSNFRLRLLLSRMEIGACSSGLSLFNLALRWIFWLSV